MDLTETVEIQELDLDLIQPTEKTMYDKEQGGSAIIVVGKPGTGKSTLITSLMYAKKRIYNISIAISDTDEYKTSLSDTGIFVSLDENKLVLFKKQQLLTKKYMKNPWSMLLVNDCDPEFLRTSIFKSIFINGRCWKMSVILSIQCGTKIHCIIGSNAHGVFILCETDPINRKYLYETHAGIIPTFNIFCDMMDQITDDYSALYLHNSGKEHDYRKNIFLYKFNM